MPTLENRDGTTSVRELERRVFLLRWGKRLLCAALIAAISSGGYRGYRLRQTRQLTHEAQQLVQRGDYQNAALVARRLLALEADHLIANRIMAELAEIAGDAKAVHWRTRTAHLEPGVADNQVLLAKAALRFGQLSLAENVITHLPESARQGAQYHEVAGTLALAQKNVAAAEQHYAVAARLDPANHQRALSLATVRLGSSDAEISEAADGDLVLLTARPEVRSEALRALTTDALSRNKRELAIDWAEQLRAEKSATFADTLLYLESVHGTGVGDIALAETKSKALKSANDTAQLLTWLNRHGLAQAAREWAADLPAAIAETQPVPLAIAESLGTLQDWNALLASVEGKNWGQAESVRLAVQSHALRRLHAAARSSTEAQPVWRAALRAAQTHPQHLLAIGRLAEEWGDDAQAEEVWWMVTNGRDHTGTGLAALSRLYKAKQDTRGLLRVAKRALELDPNDLGAANNCANLGVLLNGDGSARRLAARLHAGHPSNRTFAATYAYALHSEGKLSDGLKIIETLKEDELRNPAIAAYYFVMLVDNGKLERARQFLAHAKRAALLPEEQRLLTAATRKLLASDTEAVAKAVAGSH